MSENLGLMIPEPNADLAEKALIGALIIDDGLYLDAAARVDSADFRGELARRAYDTIKEAREAGVGVDLITIDAALRSKGFEQPFAYELAGWAENAFPPHSVAYAKAIREAATLRKCRTKIIEYFDQNPGVPYFERVMELVGSLRDAIIAESEEPRPIADGLYRMMKAFDLSGTDQALAMKFPGLDDFFKLKRKELVVVAARPSMGKSALTTQMLLGLWQARNHSALFSLEGNLTSVAARLISHICEIENFRVQQNRLSDSEYARITAIAPTIQEMGISILDSENDWERIKTHMARFKLRNPQVAVFAIDYLGLINVPGNFENRTLQVGKVTRESKKLAQELDVAIILVCQLSRAVESRQDKHPILSDLRESGNIEQDADQVVFLYRDKYYDKTAKDDIVEIDVAKCRDGKVGVRRMIFVPEFLKFRSIEDYFS
jgi:replicative DNA helicase